MSFERLPALAGMCPGLLCQTECVGAYILCWTWPLSSTQQPLRLGVVVTVAVTLVVAVTVTLSLFVCWPMTSRPLWRQHRLCGWPVLGASRTSCWSPKLPMIAWVCVWVL